MNFTNVLAPTETNSLCKTFSRFIIPFYDPVRNFIVTCGFTVEKFILNVSKRERKLKAKLQTIFLIKLYSVIYLYIKVKVLKIQKI